MINPTEEHIDEITRDLQFNQRLSSKIQDLKHQTNQQTQMISASVNLRSQIQVHKDKVNDILRKINQKQHLLDSQIKEIEFEKSNSDNLITETETNVKNDDFKIPEQIRRRNRIYDYKLYLIQKQKKNQLAQTINQLPNQSQINILKASSTTLTQEQVILESLFDQLEKNSGQIQKIQFKTFLKQNKNIALIYGLSENDLDATGQFWFDKQQFVDLLIKSGRNIQERPIEPILDISNWENLIRDHEKIDLYRVDEYRFCLLSAFEVDILKDIFDEIDEENKQIIKQCVFLEKLRVSEKSQNLLYKKCVYLKKQKISLTLEQVIQNLELEECRFCEENEEQIGYFVISWHQFHQYLENIAKKLNQNQEFEQENQKDEQLPFSDKSDTDDEDLDIYLTPQKKRKPSFVTNNDFKHYRKITVPVHFNFLLRPKSATKREKYIQEQVDTRDKLREQEYKYIPFKANNIPSHVQNRELWTWMMERQQEKRNLRLNKENLEFLTKQIQQPFSFDKYDQLKQKFQTHVNEIQENEKKLAISFKAKPAPWYSTVALFERKKIYRETRSKIRREARKRWLIQNSKLPERMQLHDEIKKREDLEKKIADWGQAAAQYPKQYPFKPQPPKPVPDFERLHKEFENNLINKQKKNKKTKVEPFNFTFNDVKNKKSVESTPQQISIQKECPLKKAQRILQTEPKLQAGTTQKFEDMVAKLQRERELKEMVEEQKLYEQAQREEKKQLFLPRVMKGLDNIKIQTGEREKEELNYQKMMARMIMEKQQQQHFNEQMRQMFIKVYNKPLLMETQFPYNPTHHESHEHDMEEQNSANNYMNPIGEDDEIEYEQQQQQAIEEEQEYEDYETHSQRTF